MKYLIVGSGLFGSVFAHEAARRKNKVTIIEKRDHIAGNIYTKEVDGIQVHEYGAHIFHTSNKKVWNYVHQFANFNRYTNSPVANYKGHMYNLPFNMNTFSEMWGVRTPQEASAKINEQRQEMAVKEPKNLEEQAISLIGRDIYEKLVKGYTEKQFKKHIDQMFDNSVKLNMNAVIVQIRPTGDALYDSDYFPWSVYVSGKQGKNPGFDPLKYMVKAAHKRGLEFHAWLNPYRVTLNSTNYKTLSKDNPARIWHEDKNKKNDRNVLKFGKSLYYNPASKQVQNMIISDIGNIVKKYDVDGIHFDDYFYPSLGKSYQKNFDYKEYNTYKKNAVKSGKTPMSIVAWRRNNVNTLVRNTYKTIKKIDPSVSFGISPHGNISNLMAKDKYYVDVKKWLSNTGYVDYIAPQIYWSFTHKICPFDDTVDEWLDLRTKDSINIYIGIANYKAKEKIKDDPEWKKVNNELKRQVEYGRKTGSVDGFCFFRYEHLFKKSMKIEVNNLTKILNKR